MRRVRVALAVVLLALAVFAALLASDLHAWQRTLRSDDALRQAATPATLLPIGLTEGLLNVRDDLAYRHALILFAQDANAVTDLENAVGSSIARSQMEIAVSHVASGGGDARRLSQMGTLEGILAFGDFARGNHDPAQSAAAKGALENSIVLDSSNEDAKYDLELVQRLLGKKGIGAGFSNQASPGAQNKRGAGAGAPGSGY